MQMQQIIAQPVIDTDRFVLRPLRKSDKGLIEMYAGTEQLARMTTSIPHPLPPGATEAFIARALSSERTEDIWALDGTGLGASEVMGIISLEQLDRNQSEVGYWVAPPFWNAGVAQTAVEAILRENPQQSDTVFASVFQDNPASARVLIKCGFEYLGDAESFSVARNATVPTWTYTRKL